MKRRNCHDVILDMVFNIPENEIELLKDLKWNYEDSLHKPPEETLQWERTMMTLVKHIPVPKKDWEFEILSIFTTKSIDEIKKML